MPSPKISPNPVCSASIKVQNLNLPKGGGAMRGMAEQLQVDEFTGTVGIDLPITLTPCRDFTPVLSLSYTSSVGNGTWGLGVELNLPSIARRTNKGVPEYTNQDVFLLSGADYLVPISNAQRTETLTNKITYQVQTYAPCIEGLFALIEYWQAGNESFWRLIHQDHSIQIFGFSAQARIIDPQQPEHIFQWLLEESYDSKGQHHLYFYKAEDQSHVAERLSEKNRAPFANRYLQTIRYGNQQALEDSLLLTNDPALKDPNQWHFEVVFDYGQYDIDVSNLNPYQPVSAWACRPDAFSTYHAGFEIRTYRRCQNILMFHRFLNEFPDNPNPILVHATQYRYTTLTASQLSVLNSVQSIAYHYQNKNYTTLALPALLLSYQAFTPNESEFSPLTRNDNGTLAGVDEAPYYQLVDLWGAGLPGILYADGQSVSYQEVASAIPNLQYEAPQNLDPFPLSPTTTLMDIDANGKMDLLAGHPDCYGYYEAQTDASWQNFRAFDHYPNDLTEEQQQWVDVTGNGLADIVQLNGATLTVFPALGAQGWGAPYQQIVPDNFPSNFKSSATQLVSFADLAGTGLPQLIQISNGEVKYWPSLGYGRFANPITMDNAPWFNNADNFDIKRLFVVDVDGSGASDLVYVHTNKIVLYSNQSGNGFAKPIEIFLPIDFDNLDQIRFVDLYGQGTTGMLLSLPHSIDRPAYLYCDLCQRHKPYLLTTLDNQCGGKTTFCYSSSVAYYLADKQAGRPWKTTLPFPIPVLAKCITEDYFSKSTTTQIYRYHHGYYDGVEREFRGFACVERQDSEVFDQQNNACYVAPALSKTWYSVGSIGNTFTQQLREEYYAGDPAAFIFPDSQLIDTSDIATAQQSYRALKGKTLRIELYGLDNNAQANCPYSVRETNYEIITKQNKANNPYAIFYVHPQQSMHYNYERTPNDPVINHDVNLAIDPYGNVLQSCNIYYPRRNVSDATLSQQQLYIYLTTVDYINQTAVADYVLGVPAETRQYHIHGLMPAEGQAFSYLDLQQSINTYLHALTNQQVSSSNATLYAWERYYYAQVNAQGTQALNFRQIVLPVLLYRQATAAFLQTELNILFTDVLTASALQKQLQQGHWDNQENGDTPDYWWASGSVQLYQNNASFYLPKAIQDPTGNTTSYEYDIYQLLLTQVIDPLNNRTQVTGIDYQFIAPWQMQDINGNYSAIHCDALGRVVYSTHYGHEASQATGFATIDQAPSITPTKISDILANPENYLGHMGAYYFYDDFAYVRAKEPVTTLLLTATRYPNASTNPIQIQLVFTDGIGRDLQTKILVEGSATRWLASGKIIYNNKGGVVRQYEPYYIDVPDYINDSSLDLDSEQYSTVFFYDPLNRIYQTLTPKGFLTQSQWSAWAITTYDENDTILIAPYYLANDPQKPNPNSPYYDANILPEEQMTLSYAATYYANTPTQTILDNRGLPILTLEQNNYPDTDGKLDSEQLKIVKTYDVLGRPLTDQDPRFSQMSNSIYNCQNFYSTLIGSAFKSVSVDAGSVWKIFNVFGQPIFTYDSRHTAITVSYDALQRPLSKQVIKTASSTQDTLTLNQITEYFSYGEDQPDAEQYNLRGQLYQHFDQAGMTLSPSFSLLGLPLQTQHYIRDDYQNEANWPSAMTDRMALLQKTVYATSTNYDALGRTIMSEDIDHNITVPSYYISGRLQGIQVTTASDQKIVNYVQNIIYNPKGQRVSMQLGNGTSTAYAYEPSTLRLRSLITSKSNTNILLQSLQYQYDPVGNVIAKTDTTQTQQFYNNQKITPQTTYQYDALYRLIKATGREAIGQQTSNTRDIVSVGYYDLQALQNYVEQYSYDLGGNLLQKQHQVGTKNMVVNYVVSSTSNRAVIASLSNPTPTSADLEQYFDARGNLLRFQTSAPMCWDYRNQLQQIILIERPESQNDTEDYVYDAHGQRTRKICCRYASDSVCNIEETLYLGNVEIRRSLQQTALNNIQTTEEYHSLRILDDKDCIATCNYWIKGAPPDSLANPVVFYHLHDYLGSSTVEVDATANLISQEEYYPYGGNAIFTGSAKTNMLKHYRYSGQECDSVSGLYYYGARYYAPWLCRWLNPDPAGAVDGLNIYLFVKGNPITYRDDGGNMRRSGGAPTSGGPVLRASANNQNKHHPYHRPNSNASTSSSSTPNNQTTTTPVAKEKEIRDAIEPDPSFKKPIFSNGTFVQVEYESNTGIATYSWSKKALKDKFVQGNDKSLYLYIKSQIRQKYFNANESIKQGLKAWTQVTHPVNPASSQWIKVEWPHLTGKTNNLIPKNPSGGINIRASLREMDPPKLNDIHTGAVKIGTLRGSTTITTPYIDSNNRGLDYILLQDVDESIARNQGGETIVSSGGNPNNQKPLNAFINSTAGSADRQLHTLGNSHPINRYAVAFV